MRFCRRPREDFSRVNVPVLVPNDKKRKVKHGQINDKIHKY
jgi:hypothetical protein